MTVIVFLRIFKHYRIFEVPTVYILIWLLKVKVMIIMINKINYLLIII